MGVLAGPSVRIAHERPAYWRGRRGIAPTRAEWLFTAPRHMPNDRQLSGDTGSPKLPGKSEAGDEKIDGGDYIISPIKRIPDDSPKLVAREGCHLGHEYNVGRVVNPHFKMQLGNEGAPV